MEEIGRPLIIFGIVIAVFGVFLILGGKIPFFGKLPGDIFIQRGNFSFYFPLATSTIISVILSIVFWLVNRR